MCGRYTLTRPTQEVADAFDAGAAPAGQARYNVAPTQSVLVFRRNEGGRECQLMRWGFASQRGGKAGPPLINAMAETAASKPTFRASFARRRCLVPADGFYEWAGVGKAKRPLLF